MSAVRSSWTKRLAALAVLAGVLIQAMFSLPVMLRMAEAAPICGSAHPAGNDQAPSLPSHDHAHCLLCQGGGGPLSPPQANVVAQLPAAFTCIAADHTMMVATAPVPGFGYSPRAPPVLA